MKPWTFFFFFFLIELILVLLFGKYFLIIVIDMLLLLLLFILLLFYRLKKIKLTDIQSFGSSSVGSLGCESVGGAEDVMTSGLNLPFPFEDQVVMRGGGRWVGSEKSLETAGSEQGHFAGGLIKIPRASHRSGTRVHRL